MSTKPLYAMVLDCQDTFGRNHTVELVTQHNFEDLMVKSKYYLLRSSMTTITISRRMDVEIGLFKVCEWCNKVMVEVVAPKDPTVDMAVFLDAWIDEQRGAVVTTLSVSGSVEEAKARIASML